MTSLFDLPFEEPEPEPMVEPPPPPRAAASDDAVLTVSGLTAVLRGAIESQFARVWVEGELSNCRAWNTGHLYFTLKDAGAQIRGVMFRSRCGYLKFKPEDGLRVVARGRISVYEPKGEYQIVCEHLEPQGLGALQLAFEQLKQRLAARGPVRAARKRPLPALPRKIGIVTSLDGAAVRDIIKVLRRRYPNAHIVIRPARVQGEGAALDIARAHHGASRAVDGVDVVIVGRGGGSIEDLWAFNEEVVARAIAACPVPVISAVGHETDFTIADFVADLRAPTPSAAAAMVVGRTRRLLHRRSTALGARLDAAIRRAPARGCAAALHAAAARPALAGWPGRVALRARQVGELAQDLRARAARPAVVARARASTLLDRRLEARDLRRRVGDRARGASARPTARCRRDPAPARTRTPRASARLAGAPRSAQPARRARPRLRGLLGSRDRDAILRDAADAAPGDPVRVTLARGELERHGHRRHATRTDPRP